MLCLHPSPAASLCLVNATLGYVCNVEVSTSSLMQVTQSHSNTLKAFFFFPYKCALRNESPSWEQVAHCTLHFMLLGESKGQGEQLLGEAGMQPSCYGPRCI